MSHALPSSPQNRDKAIFEAIVERDGKFWVQNLPLNNGTNFLSLTVTDAMGNVAETNIMVFPGPVALTINSPSPDLLWGLYVTVTGTISAPDDYTVWVNGVKATVAGNAWTAEQVYLPTGGTAVIQARAIPNSDNGGYGTGGSGGGPVSAADLGNPDPSADNDAELQGDKPSRILIMDDDFHWWGWGGDLNPPSWQKADSDISWVRNKVSPSYYHLWGRDGTADYDSMTRYVYPACGWDLPPTCEEGVSTTVSTYAGVTTTNTTEGQEPPVVMMEGGSVEGRLDWGYAQRWAAHSHVVLQTGGKGKSGMEDLYQITAGAVNYPSPFEDGETVAFANLVVGELGQLGNDGKLWVALPADTTKDVTVQAKGANYYTFNVQQQKYKLTHTCEADTPTNKDRLTVGVCEQVDLGGMPDNTEWSLAGGGSLSGTNGSGVTFMAQDTEGAATITATVGSASLTLNFGVVKPSGAILENIPGTLSINQNPLGVFCYAYWYIPPDSVSFYNIKIAEGFTNAIATGYFDSVCHWNNLLHTPGSPLQGGAVISGKGTLCSGSDQVTMPTPGPPYSGGTFVWHIPWSYITPRGTTNYFTTVDHYASLTATSTNNATLTLQKGGAGGSVSTP